MNRDEDRISELLRRLENPMSFIGETRPSHVFIDGERTSISELIRRASVDPRSRDTIISLLKDRLMEIKDSMRNEGKTFEEARILYEEAIAVKHTLHVLKKKSDVEEDPHADMRRWMDFGKRLKKR